MVILGYRVAELFKKTWSEVWKDNVLGMSAEAAYNLFFSMFPLFLFIAPLLGLVGDEAVIISSTISRLAPVLPPGAMEVVDDVLHDVVFSETAPALMSVGALLAAYTGSNMIATIASALNRAYGVTDPRPFLKRRLLAIALMIAVGIALTISTTVIVGSKSVFSWLVRTVGVEPQAAAAWQILRYPVSFAFVVGVLWLIYYFMPAIKQKKSHALTGAIFAATAWVAVTMIFRFYVMTAATYSSMYGVLGGVIVLLTWLYLTMFVVIVGGELNSELARGTGATRQREPVLYGGRITTTDQIDEPSPKIQ
ncbi:MAG TPA: YihY/virulence factor BrkB family protein [Gemmatimonadaceae bacterium]|nr:YihY/virulence factor BrkB family protein [Gemmatimonadaceae bacterium]